MIRTRPTPALLLLCLAALTLVAGPACRHETLDIDIVVTDDSGVPVEGALVYFEAFEINEGAFDFGWGYTDPLGRPLTEEGFTPTIAWSSSARLACAAFVPGTKPAAFIDRDGGAHLGRISLIMEDTATTTLDFQPTLTKLTFPFESAPDLAKHLREPTNRPLLEAFRTAYEPLTGGDMPTTEEERNKALFLRDLLRAK